MFNDALEESQFIKLCFSIAWASGLFMIMPLMGMQGVAGNTVRTTRIDTDKEEHHGILGQREQGKSGQPV